MRVSSPVFPRCSRLRRRGGRALTTSAAAALVSMISAMSCGPDRILSPAPDQLASARDAGELLDHFETSYRTRSMRLLQRLVAHPEHGIEFTFVRDNGNDIWNLTTFLRVHQRLFGFEEIVFEPPDPSAPWISSLGLELTPTGPFTERSDLLEPEGTLDPARWRPLEVECDTSIYLNLEGETDYTITGPSRFIIVEDVQKTVGEEGKFLFFQIEDLRVPLEPPTLASTPGSLIALDR